MRITSAMRRTAVGTASLLALALLAGCGGSDGKDGKADGDKGNGSQKPGASAPAGSGGKVLTAAELETAVVQNGDVKGHKFSKLPAGADIDAKSVTTDKPDCTPLARALVAKEYGEPKATAQRTGISERDKSAKKPHDMAGAFNITKSGVNLSSYEGDGAQDVLDALDKGIKSCGGGFKGSARGETMPIVKITADKAPDLGDGAVAFTAISKDDGTEAPFKVVVVRKGSTVVCVTSLNMAALSSGKDFPFPVEIVKAQVDKLS